MQSNESGPPTHPMYKDKHKMDHIPKYKSRNCKTPRKKKKRCKSSQAWVKQWFLRHDTRSTSNRRINWTSSKLTTFVLQRTLSRKRKPTEWGEIFMNLMIIYIPDKGLVSKIYKEHLQLNKNMHKKECLQLNNKKTNQL